MLDYPLMPALPAPEDDGGITLSVRPSVDGASSSVSIRISPKRPRVAFHERDVEVDATTTESPPAKRRNTGEGARVRFT